MIPKKIDPPPAVATAEQVIYYTMGVDRDALYSRRRPQHLANARHLFFWLLHHHFKLTKIQIAAIGPWDHTTVIHGIRRYDDPKQMELSKQIVDAFIRIKLFHEKKDSLTECGVDG